jgi:hypothetical protein
VIRNDLSNDPFPPNYLKVRLISPQCQAGAFGAMTRVYLNGQAGIPASFLDMRESTGNTGYLAQNDPVLHFGIANELAVDVEVTWPDGTTTTVTGALANQTITIDECPP